MRFLSLIFTVGLPVLADDKSEIVSKWAADLQVEYKVLTNIDRGDRGFKYQVTFSTVKETIGSEFPWCIYFDQDQGIWNGTEWIRREGSYVGSGLTAHEVNGYIHKFCHTNDDKFNEITPDAPLILTLEGSSWINQDSTLYPNWFFACNGRCGGDVEDCCAPAIIKSTTEFTYQKPNYVAPFDTIETQLRRPEDKFHPLSPQERFDDLESKEPKTRVYGLPVLPQPALVRLTPTEKQIDADGNPIFGVPIHQNVWNIEFENACNQDISLIKSEQLNVNNKVIGKMTFSLDEISEEFEEGLAWLIKITGTEFHQIEVVSTNCQGQVMAVKFITKLIKQLKRNEKSFLLNGFIGGKSPRFNTRAMFLDLSRNFYGYESVIELLSIMGPLELNQLHLRLHDDEGWRIEIKQLPELTDIGSNRCFDPIGDKCIWPQFGSGPEPNDGAGSGFVSQEEYIKILEYASELGIRVVPEIVAPSHAAAAVQAMKQRNDPNFLLSDPDQEHDSTSVQGFYDDIMNPCMESTYDFLNVVAGEIAELHRRVDPDFQLHNHFHIGGDEANTRDWKGSDICVNFLVETGMDWEDLGLYFFKQYMKIVSAYGFNIDGWEEVWEFEIKDEETGRGTGLYDIHDPSIWTDYINEDTILTAYHWNNGWLDYDTSSTGYMMANKGYQVILAPATHIYFDMAQDRDPNTRGLMWATRYSDLWKAFSLRPMDLNANGLWSYWGERIDFGCIDQQNGKNFNCTSLEKPENIAGISGCMWMEENVRKEFMWEKIFPQITAVAERSYRQAIWETIFETSSWDAVESNEFKEDFARFKDGLQNWFSNLEQEGFEYSLPKTGVNDNNGKFQFRNLYTHNPNLFRWKGENDEWISWDELRNRYLIT